MSCIMASNLCFFNRLCFVTVSWIILTISAQQDGIMYGVVEEGSAQSVGNPVTDSMLESSLGSLSDYQFSFVSPNNSQSRHFTIDQATGQISTLGPIDRETICSVGPCPINLDVAVQSMLPELELVKILRVRMKVIDVNDNAPVFPDEVLEVSISESAPVATTIGLYAASDADATANNSRISYNIIPSDGFGKFGIAVINNFDGSTDVGVSLKQTLDRETTEFYQVKLIAKDGGSPSLTGTMTINVKITDSNDHNPVFTKPMYNITIQENVTIGTEILRVAANDRDMGRNAQVSYRFDSRSASKIASVFKIGQETGAVTVQEAVNFETDAGYQLIVEAIDHGIPPKSSQAVVIIKVLDVNDNAPVITFNLLAGGDHGIVSEFAKPGSFVGHVSVIDPDSNVDQHITCSMKSEEFSLQRLGDKEYKIILLTKLNREVAGRYNLSVHCSDNGSPSYSSHKSLLVVVKDENDHSPVFNQTLYTKSILENFPVGQTILQVSANDQDAGQNGNISYKLSGDNGSFTIDTVSGAIMATKLLDREDEERITIQVLAVDNGNPQKTTTADVILTLIDINDEPPKFTQIEYVVWINENESQREGIVHLAANDSDTGSGGQFQFSIAESSTLPGVFRINPYNGVIRTARVFDREEQDKYRIVVTATDKGEPPLSSSTIVWVKIQDKNDNEPVFLFPSSTNNTVKLSSGERETYVATVIASDADVGGNGRITYSIEEFSSSQFLYVDDSSGAIRLTQALGMGMIGQHVITILAQDNGYPARFARQKLYIIVEGSNVTALASATEPTSPNMSIVIAVVSVTVIVSLAIALVICVIKKHDRVKESEPPKMEEERIMRRRGSSSTASKTSQQSDLSTITCLDELRKDISFSLNDVSHGYSTFNQPLSTCYLFNDVPTKLVRDTRQSHHSGNNNDKYDALQNGVTSLITNHTDFHEIPHEDSPMSTGHKESDNWSEGLTSSDSGRGASDDDITNKSHLPDTNSSGENYVRFIPAICNPHSYPETNDADEIHYYDMTVLRKSKKRREQVNWNKPQHPSDRPVSFHTDLTDQNKLAQDDRVNSDISLSPYSTRGFGNQPSLVTFGKHHPKTDSRSYSIEMTNLDTCTSTNT